MDRTERGKGEHLQTNLKALREAAGFSSVRDFQKATGIHRGLMSRWERCKELPFPDERDMLESVLGERPWWRLTVTFDVELPERVMAKR